MTNAGYKKIEIIGKKEFTKVEAHDNKEMVITNSGEELKDFPAAAEFYYGSQFTRFPYEL